jgi:multiple sugar transport system substrate-binding protein
VKRSCLFLFVAPSVLSGCGDPRDGKVHLRYMAWGNVQQLNLEQRIVDEFNKRNPDIVVKLFKVPQNSYKNKMVVMFASRTAPDVVRVDHYDFSQLAERNYFHDLDEFIARDPEYKKSDFSPLANEECMVGGKTQGLNVLFGGGIMFYNKSLVADAGLEDPNELWKGGKWNYDKVLEYARKLTKFDSTGRPTQFGINIPPSPFYLAIVQAFGGRFLNKSLDNCLLDTPEAIAGMQWISDLRWRYKCCPTPAQGANAAFAFETGKLALSFDYVGMTARYNELITKFKWDICPMPMGPKGDSFFVKGNQLVMDRQTKHPEESWRFMKFVTGPIAEDILYIQARRQAPTRIALQQSNAFLHPKMPPFNMEAVALTIKKGKTLPIGPRWPEVTAILTPELDNLFAGRETDAAKAMRHTTDAINKVLSEEEGL